MVMGRRIKANGKKQWLLRCDVSEWPHSCEIEEIWCRAITIFNDRPVFVKKCHSYLKWFNSILVVIARVVISDNYQFNVSILLTQQTSGSTWFNASICRVMTEHNDGKIVWIMGCANHENNGSVEKDFFVSILPWKSHLSLSDEVCSALIQRNRKHTTTIQYFNNHGGSIR
jgi:hypothetical protein